MRYLLNFDSAEYSITIDLYYPESGGLGIGARTVASRGLLVEVLLRGYLFGECGEINASFGHLLSTIMLWS